MSVELIERAENLLEERLTEGAYAHSLGVAAMAQMMATLYGVDPIDAYLGGLLHDWDRCLGTDELVTTAERFGIELTPTLLENPRLLHAHTGAHHLAVTFPELPADVIDAVANHTVGRVEMSDLDMVVYVADMVEPSRDYPGVDDLREMIGTIALEDLFRNAYAQTMKFLVAHRKIIHPDTLAVWNWLMRTT